MGGGESKPSGAAGGLAGPPRAHNGGRGSFSSRRRPLKERLPSLNKLKRLGSFRSAAAGNKLGAGAGQSGSGADGRANSAVVLPKVLVHHSSSSSLSSSPGGWWQQQHQLDKEQQKPAWTARERPTPQGLRQALFRRSQSMGAVLASRNARGCATTESAPLSSSSEGAVPHVDEEDEDQDDGDLLDGDKPGKGGGAELAESDGPADDGDCDCDDDCQEDGHTGDVSLSPLSRDLSAWLALKSVQGPVGIAAPQPPKKPSLPRRSFRSECGAPSLASAGKKKIKRLRSLPVAQHQ